MRQRLIMMAVVTVLASATDAQAQASERIHRLRPEGFVRIRTAEGMQEGRLAKASRDSIWLVGPRGTTATGNDRVEELWSRKTAGGRGALIGAALGGVFVGAIASALTDAVESTFCQPFECEKESGSTVASGIIIGGVGGGLAGFLIGRTIKRWERRFP